MNKAERWIRRAIDDICYGIYSPYGLRHKAYNFLYDHLHDHGMGSTMVDECCDFFNRYRAAYSPTHGIYMALVKREWLDIFDDVAYMLRVDKLEKKRILCREIWEKPPKKYTSLEDLWGDFIYDVHYCSDRWYTHRLIRCHDKFLTFCDALDKQTAIDKIKESKEKEN